MEENIRVVWLKKMFQDVLKNETLTLECGSDDCFAVITYKVSENSTISCIDTGKVIYTSTNKIEGRYM